MGTSPPSESSLTVPPGIFSAVLAPVSPRLTGDDLDRLADRTDPETQRQVLREGAARALAARDPEILATYVTRTVYRLVRELGRTLGNLGYDEALSSLTIDRLFIPQPLSDAPYTLFSIEAYAEARRIADLPGPVPSLPLMPSSNHYFEAPAIQQGYTTAMRALVNFLRLHDTDYGPPSLPFLFPFNPANWPTAPILYAYEATLIDEVLTTLVEDGTHTTEQALQHQYGMLPHESRGLVRLAKLEATARMEADIDQDRAVLAMRLEDLIKRARESLDTRVELGAIKQLAVVQGVTRAEPEDVQSEFAKVVRKVAAAEPPKQLEAPD